MIRTWVLIPLTAVLLATAGCGSSSDRHVAKRSHPLRTYAHDDALAIHVTDSNDHVGPSTQTVTIPATSSAMIVRFDCVGKTMGDVAKFIVSVSTLGYGGSNCNSIGESGWSSGGTDVKGRPVIRKGDKITIKVKVAADVHWSLSLDLPKDDAAYDRLAGVA